jgi:hypothetical protein
VSEARGVDAAGERIALTGPDALMARAHAAPVRNRGIWRLTPRSPPAARPAPPVPATTRP